MTTLQKELKIIIIKKKRIRNRHFLYPIKSRYLKVEIYFKLLISQSKFSDLRKFLFLEIINLRHQNYRPKRKNKEKRQNFRLFEPHTYTRGIFKCFKVVSFIVTGKQSRHNGFGFRLWPKRFFTFKGLKNWRRESTNASTDYCWVLYLTILLRRSVLVSWCMKVTTKA